MSAPHMPQAWVDLIEGLTLLARGQTSEISPLWCEHDVLHICADADAFTDAELDRLDVLGFTVDDEDGFKSFRFGSA